jgi:Clostripain family
MADKTKWTIMLYLAGDNNLSHEMVWALKEAYRVGTPEGVAVTVQFDPSAEGRSTRFYHLRSKPVDVDGVFPILQDVDLPEGNTGDPDVLVDFIKRSVTDAPADYYMLILSGHGGGIVGDFLTDTGVKHELQPGSLTIPDLRKVLARLRETLPKEFFAEQGDETILDVLGMDSCLMSMAEICSEIKGDVMFLVGSEGFDPNTGWPYFRFLERLRKRQDGIPEPEALARALVDGYTTYYSDFTAAGLSVDISACDVSRTAMEPLEEAVKEFVEFYLEQTHPIDPTAGDKKDEWIQNAILLAHFKAQSYKWEQYTDVWDFFDLLARELDGLAYDDRYLQLADKCRKICTSLTKVVKVEDFVGVDFQHSHGLSIYFPWSRRYFAEEYRSTAFAQATRWADFLARYLDGTQRKMRDLSPMTEVRTSVGAGDTPTSIQASSLTLSGSVRVNAPSSRVNAPSSRVNAPSSRVNAPSSRFAQQLDSLMNELPSYMKNPPTNSEDVVRFIGAEGLQTIKKLDLPRFDEIQKVLNKSAVGKRLLTKVEIGSVRMNEPVTAEHSSRKSNKKRKVRSPAPYGRRKRTSSSRAPR